MNQTLITKKTPLLNERGNLTQPGYCVKNLYTYDRDKIRAGATRIKEWDFYQVSNSRYMMQMTLADISLGGAGAFTLIDMQTGKRYDSMGLSLLTFGKLGLESDTEAPHYIYKKQKNFDFSVEVTQKKRMLRLNAKAGGKPVKVEVDLDIMPDLESMTMAVPFSRPGYFYLNQKINSMPASGTVTIGSEVIKFDPEDSFGVLDWGRGVWPYKCSWYWGNGTTRLENGKLFGFEIGWGFGDMSAASENMLFYDGKAHKINGVFLKKDENDWMLPWTFSSDDGRFEMTMTPFYDNYTSSRVLVLGNKCHQVFGEWNGKVVLDNGEVLEIRDMVAFCEFSDNRW